MSTIYERIKNRRQNLNMSQQELAEEMGYTSRSSIAKIEAGKNDIPQSKIVSFAEALETTPAYLMGWTDDPVDYDNIDDMGMSKAYRDENMSAKDYYSFKKAEFEDMKREHSNPPIACTLTAHEEDVITAYRSLPRMQPAVDKILGIDEPTRLNLLPNAAHEIEGATEEDKAHDEQFWDDFKD